MTGFDSTNFDIEVTSIDNNDFIGKVQDDLTTGEQKVLEIVGKISGDKVAFVKQMPIMTLIVDKNGTRKTLIKRHKKIYYSGTFSRDRTTISGQWKFKFGFIWVGLIPVPIFPINGTWTMTFNG
jgi:hypothetical protein